MRKYVRTASLALLDLAEVLTASGEGDAAKRLLRYVLRDARRTEVRHLPIRLISFRRISLRITLTVDTAMNWTRTKEGLAYWHRIDRSVKAIVNVGG